MCFEDNGIGFDQKDREKIFELFKRLHTRNEYSGTGIGLAIVKKIVENHDGFISAESHGQKGAGFTILLPAN
jgi:signal transduction histidine kinase